jgi:hypothetical protein
LLILLVVLRNRIAVLLSQPRRQKGAGASVDLPLGVADGHLKCPVRSNHPRESFDCARPAATKRADSTLLSCIPQSISDEENQSEGVVGGECLFNCCLGRKRDEKGLKKRCKVFALFPQQLRWYWATIAGVRGNGGKRTFNVRAFIGPRVGTRNAPLELLLIDLQLRYSSTMVSVETN